MPTQELLTDLCCQLSREGKAVLMSTHDVVAAVHTCDRVVLLNRTVVADGTPTEVQDRRLWMQAFEVGSASPLLTGVGV